MFILYIYTPDAPLPFCLACCLVLYHITITLTECFCHYCIYLIYSRAADHDIAIPSIKSIIYKAKIILFIVVRCSLQFQSCLFALLVIIGMECILLNVGYISYITITTAIKRPILNRIGEMYNDEASR